MKKVFVIIMALPLMLMGCTHKEKTAEQVPADTISTPVDSVLAEEEGEEVGEGLNAIRFNHFTDEDWLDNEYIRSLRKYITDYNNGKFEYEELDPYKDKMRGQFAVLSISPFITGGAFIYIVFIDNPKYLFAAWVYSGVDETSRTVMDYSVRSIKMEDDNCELTKEEILQAIKEHPENKLW